MLCVFKYDVFLNLLVFISVPIPPSKTNLQNPQNIHPPNLQNLQNSQNTINPANQASSASREPTTATSIRASSATQNNQQFSVNEPLPVLNPNDILGILDDHSNSLNSKVKIEAIHDQANQNQILNNSDHGNNHDTGCFLKCRF